MGSYSSIITLSVNGLNAPTKRQILPDWIQKQDPYICCLQETHLKTRDTYRLKVKGWKKIFHTNGDQKKAGVAILIPDKVKVKSFCLFGTPWTVAYQVPPSMGLSRQEYWSGLPFPSPGDLPKPVIKSGSSAL